MKIVVTLMVEEAGRVHYVKRPGALLEAGCVIARLELDDPTKVKPVSLLGLATLLSPPLLSTPKQHPMGQQRNCPGSGMGRDVPMLSPWPSHGHATSGCSGAHVAAPRAMVLPCMSIPCTFIYCEELTDKFSVCLEHS